MKGKYIKIMSLLLVIILNASVQATDHKNCHKNPMYCQILKWRPTIDEKWAMKFSDLLYRYGKKYNMDPWRSLAIAMQESSLRNIHRKHSIVKFKQKCVKKRCRQVYNIYRGYSDLSIFQFHIMTALANKMDIIRLNTDLDYAVKEHFILLKKKEARCHKLGKLSWSCYHSTSPIRRKHYVQLVNRYFVHKADRSVVLAAFSNN